MIPSRLLLGLLIFCILLMTPVHPSVSVKAADNNWSGAVTTRNTRWLKWSRLDTLNRPMSGRGYEVVIRKLYILDNGQAYETLKANGYFEEQEQCWDGIRVRYKSYSAEQATEPRSYTLFLTDFQAFVQFKNEPYEYPITVKGWGGCSGISSQETVYPTHWHLSLTPEDADLSADLQELVAFHKETGYNPYGTNIEGGEYWIWVTNYDLSRTPKETCWLDPETRDHLRFNAKILSAMGKTLGAMAVICAATPCAPAAAAMALEAMIWEGVGWGTKKLAEDPPDTNYTELAKVVPAKTSLQPILPGNGISTKQAAAMNDLMDHDGLSIGLQRAILQSFDRATGAQVANDNYWVNRQLQEARSLAGQLGEHLKSRPQLAENLKKELSTNPNFSFDITMVELAAYNQQLAINGYSASQKQTLSELGFTAQEQQLILHEALLNDLPFEDIIHPKDPPSESLAYSSLEELNPNIVARFPDILVDPKLNAALLALSESLLSFASGSNMVYLPLVKW